MLRESLAAVDIAQSHNSYAKMLDQFDFCVLSKTQQLSTQHEVLSDLVKQIRQSHGDFDHAINNLLAYIDSQLEMANQECEAQSLAWFLESQPRFRTLDLMRVQKLQPDPELTQELSLRIKNIQQWCWPGLIIHPGEESFIDSMTSMDPLYLVDTDQSLLEPALSKFNGLYQNRLRCYTVLEEPGQEILAQLPQGQFGLCFAWNFFEYRPWPILQQWLREIWALLRPGGRVIFTFNNCDTLQGVRFAEINWQAWSRGRDIKAFALEQGFDIVTHKTHRGINWMELERPGKLTTLRGGATMAKVVAKF